MNKSFISIGLEFSKIIYEEKKGITRFFDKLINKSNKYEFSYIDNHGDRDHYELAEYGYDYDYDGSYENDYNDSYNDGYDFFNDSTIDFYNNS